MLESSITNVDQTEFEEEINQKVLDEFTPPWVDEITPVPVTYTGQTGTLSRHGHLIKPLPVVQPSNTIHAKTLQPLRQRRLPTKRGVKKPTRSLLNAMKPGFNHPKLRKMFGLMKKLHTEKPINTNDKSIM